MSTITRRAWSTGGAAALAAALLPGAARAQSVAAKNKVVFQVSDNDPAKWALAFNNAGNIQADVGAANVDMEIVAYGPGLAMLRTGSPVAQRVTAALQSGVRVLACQNTMKAQQLSQADMLTDIGYVPSAVVELMQRQQQGYAYIRP